MMVHVEYMGKAHNVAFCAGVDPMKMLKLLRALFELRSPSVALYQRESGVMVPISQACKTPHILRDEAVYKLITLDEIQCCLYKNENDGSLEQELGKHNVQQQYAQADPTAYNRSTLTNYVFQLLAADVLMKEEVFALCQAIENNGVGSCLLSCHAMITLLREGHPSCVAILEDIASKLCSDPGRGYLRAQEDVLTACHMLMTLQRMDFQQALHIQNMLLMVPEKIVPTFLKCQEAKGWGKKYTFSDLVSDLSLILNDSTNDELRAMVNKDNQKKSKRDQILNVVKLFLVKNGLFTPNEAQVLTLMMENGNAYTEWHPTVDAAFENFKDGDVLELIDTLMRVVKIASGKRTSSNSCTSGVKRAKMTCFAESMNTPFPLPGPSLESHTIQAYSEGDGCGIKENSIWKVTEGINGILPDGPVVGLPPSDGDLVVLPTCDRESKSLNDAECAREKERIQKTVSW